MKLTQHEVSERNSAFYSRFRYPWRPRILTAPEDPNHATCFLNQALGAWQGERLPVNMRIWVAGCGTNQAVMLGLAFPQASIVATDISLGSLENSRSLANEMGLSNIEFRCESIEAITARDYFHLIVCTGVIHHNPDPGLLLRALADALRPDGILELMVYNHYHRTEAMAFQHAVRALARSAVAIGDFEAQMNVVRTLTESLPWGRMLKSLELLQGAPEEMIADALLQPLERAYTVDALAALVNRCGLRLAIPCPNQFDSAEQRPSWEMHFSHRELAQRYSELPDVERWTITNHLLLDRSPMLWFYVDRIDSPSPLPGAYELARSFARQRYERVSAVAAVYVADENGVFRRSEHRASLPSPTAPADDELRAIWDANNSTLPIGSLLPNGDEAEPATLNRLREGLTTPIGPYLKAI